MLFKSLFSRIVRILIKPRDEWVIIKQEKTNTLRLFVGYAVILAAIPEIARLLGEILGGVRDPSGRSVIFSFMGNTGIYYFMGLIKVYLAVFIIFLIAPFFESKKDWIGSAKLVVYSLTPCWLAGLIFIVPNNALRVFATLAGSLYAIYLLYLGVVSPLIDTPKENSAIFIIASSGAIVLSYVILELLVDSFLLFHAINKII